MGARTHPLSIGRSCQVRGPDALELGFAGLIVSVISALAIGFGAQLMQMTEVLDAVSLASGPQTEAVIFHAVHGRWPSPGDVEIISGRTTATYVQRLTLGKDGAITADLHLGPPTWAMDTGYGVQGSSYGRVTFQPVLFGAKDAPTISYLCGYARPAAGALSGAGSNRTTLARNQLPPFCR